MADTTDTEEESIDEKLDTSWLQKFKKEECSYNDFYKEPITSITLFILYVKDKELIHVDSNRCLLENGILDRDRIVSLIKHYEMREIKYKLAALLRYNIELNPDEIHDYIKDELVTDRFMTPEKYLKNIHYNDSIHMFQDLNALYFIYEASSGVRLNQTKKIILHSQHKTKRNNHKNKLKDNIIKSNKAII